MELATQAVTIGDDDDNVLTFQSVFANHCTCMWEEKKKKTNPTSVHRF